MFLSPCHASDKQYHVFFFPLVEFICIVLRFVQIV